MEAIPQQVSSFQMTPVCTKLTQTNQHRVQLARHRERSQALKLVSSQGHHVQWFRLFTTQTLSQKVKKELKSSQFSTCQAVCPCTVLHTQKGTLFQFTQKSLVGQLESLPTWGRVLPTTALSWQTQGPRLPGPKSKSPCKVNAVHRQADWLGSFCLTAYMSGLQCVTQEHKS